MIRINELSEFSTGISFWVFRENYLCNGTNTVNVHINTQLDQFDLSTITQCLLSYLSDGKKDQDNPPSVEEEDSMDSSIDERTEDVTGKGDK